MQFPLYKNLFTRQSTVLPVQNGTHDLILSKRSRRVRVFEFISLQAPSTPSKTSGTDRPGLAVVTCYERLPCGPHPRVGRAGNPSCCGPGAHTIKPARLLPSIPQFQPPPPAASCSNSITSHSVLLRSRLLASSF
jgi:hypothetical protein